MKVKFKREFGGRETAEIHYPPGHEMEMSDGLANDLARRGIVEILDQPQAEPVHVPEIPELDRPEPEKAELKAAPVRKGKKK
jgi:hypothetical protein